VALRRHLRGRGAVHGDAQAWRVVEELEMSPETLRMAYTARMETASRLQDRRSGGGSPSSPGGSAHSPSSPGGSARMRRPKTAAAADADAEDGDDGRETTLEYGYRYKNGVTKIAGYILTGNSYESKGEAEDGYGDGDCGQTVGGCSSPQVQTLSPPLRVTPPPQPAHDTATTSTTSTGGGGGGGGGDGGGGGGGGDFRTVSPPPPPMPTQTDGFGGGRGRGEAVAGENTATTSPGSGSAFRAVRSLHLRRGHLDTWPAHSEAGAVQVKSS
jgi:hypothetical protein